MPPREPAAMDEHVLPTYKRAEEVFLGGHGAWLVDDGGHEHLDFLAGIAVSALGHAHPRLVEALRAQAGKVLHLSNLLRNEHTEIVAERLARLSGLHSVFFCNGGSEANEARRSAQERVADLERKIAELKAKQVAREKKDDPVLRESQKLLQRLKNFVQLALDNSRPDIANSTLGFKAMLERTIQAELGADREEVADLPDDEE
jgi:hypothetical protein